MFSSMANTNWSNDMIDHKMKNHIDWGNGEKIVGILTKFYGKTDKSKENLKEKRQCEDFENLIVGILKGDINLVKLALKNGNITSDKDFAKIIVEKNGIRRMTYFFPSLEAERMGNKEITNYMKSFFANQPEKSWGFAPAKVEPDSVIRDEEKDDKVDYEINKNIEWKGGKIVGLLKPNPSPFGEPEEEKIRIDNQCKDFKKLIEGILTSDINLVKSGLKSGNISSQDSAEVVVEKNGSKQTYPFLVRSEAYEKGNKEIIDYIRKFFDTQKYKQSVFGSNRIDKVDYKIKKPITWKDGEIVGILKPSSSSFGESSDQCKEFENLIEGILKSDINLVRIGLESGNITSKSFAKVIVEKGGFKDIEYFFPDTEAYKKGNKEIINYIESVFEAQKF